MTHINIPALINSCDALQRGWLNGKKKTLAQWAIKYFEELTEG